MTGKQAGGFAATDWGLRGDRLGGFAVTDLDFCFYPGVRSRGASR
jgi:hypothetical protein